jgi:hypothetical protein
MFSQFTFSNNSAINLIREQLHCGLKMKISRFNNNKIRFPNGYEEINILAKSFKFKKLELVRFSKGSKLGPAKITFKLKLIGKNVYIRFIYYGCEYIIKRSQIGTVAII